jgi:hypothetical protein
MMLMANAARLRLVRYRVMAGGLELQASASIDIRNCPRAVRLIDWRSLSCSLGNFRPGAILDERAGGINAAHPVTQPQAFLAYDATLGIAS